MSEHTGGGTTPHAAHSHDVASLAELLRETEEHHGPYERTAPKHHWSLWYAAYITAREQGRTSEQASDEAAHYVAQALTGEPRDR